MSRNWLRILALLPVLLPIAPAYADGWNNRELIDADSEEAQRWRDRTDSNVLPIKLPNQQLIRHIQMNNTPVDRVVAEICKRGGLKVIFDKSADGRTVTGNYVDRTLNEILSSVLSSSGLRATRLCDNLLLISSVGAEHATYAEIPETELPDTAITPQRENAEANWNQQRTSHPMQYLVPPPPASSPSLFPSYQRRRQ